MDGNLLVEINKYDGKIRFVSKVIYPSTINVEDLIFLPLNRGMSLIRAGFKLFEKRFAIIAAEDVAKEEKSYLSLAEVRAGIWQNQVEPCQFKY